jgi:hypothetical protein
MGQVTLAIGVVTSPNPHSQQVQETKSQNAMEEDNWCVQEVPKGTGVRFQLVSDLHLEFPGCIYKLPHIPVNTPILCLLGFSPPPLPNK